MNDLIESLQAVLPEPTGEPPLEFLRPSEIVAYQPPPGMMLVGDCHVVCGSAFVIGGAPGVGKSRASVALALAGATQAPWFGLPVHRRFRTLIVQNENGRLRLRNEFAGLPCAELDDWVRVSPPPPFGLAFDAPAFCGQLRATCEAFRPDVVLIDPWNACARDDTASDYLATFKAIKAVIPSGESSPALGIVAHTRKPKSDEKSSGRGLLKLLAGSYVLGSVPRSAFVLQAASEDTEDPRVVFTCCKNNDGEEGAATAWIRRNGLFEAVPNFDWEEFANGSSGSAKRVAVTKEHLAMLFEHGKLTLLRKHAIELLREQTACGQSAAYNALSMVGRFKENLRENTQGFLSWQG